MFLFWGFGYPQLIHAAKKRSSSSKIELTSTAELRIDQEEGPTTNERIRDRDEESIKSQQNDGKQFTSPMMNDERTGQSFQEMMKVFATIE